MGRHVKAAAEPAAAGRGWAVGQKWDWLRLDVLFKGRTCCVHFVQRFHMLRRHTVFLLWLGACHRSRPELRAKKVHRD